MEINLISQILGYYFKPSLVLSGNLFGIFMIIRGLFVNYTTTSLTLNYFLHPSLISM